VNEKKLMPSESFVRYALDIGALELLPEGRKLKSGRISPFFFNSGLFNTGESLDRLAHAYASVINTSFNSKIDVVFGPAYKGIPLSASVAMKYWSLNGYNVGYAFNRKEVKDHGEGGLIIGTPLIGKRVLIIDDVITTGKSKYDAMKIINAEGGTPIGCIIAFDRQEKGYDPINNVDLPVSAAQEFKQEFGLPLVAAATLADLISVLEKTPAESGDDNLGEMLEKVLDYRKQYGVS